VSCQVSAEILQAGAQGPNQPLTGTVSSTPGAGVRHTAAANSQITNTCGHHATCMLSQLIRHGLRPRPDDTKGKNSLFIIRFVREAGKGGCSDMPGCPPDRIPAAWAPAYALAAAHWLPAPVLLGAPCMFRGQASAWHHDKLLP